MNTPKLVPATTLFFLFSLTGLVLTSPVTAQAPVQRTKLAVDQITLRSGIKYFGIVMSQHPTTGAKVLLERTWFKRSFPNEYRAHLIAEQKLAADANAQLLVRLKKWKEDRVEERGLIQFIDFEIDRISKAQANDDQADPELMKFCQLILPPEQVAKVFSRPSADHLIAGLAWKHNLSNVTTRSRVDLEKELENKGIDIAQEVFDFSNDFPVTSAQSDEEWNTRVCVLEYVNRERLHYQGMGSMLIKIDPDKQADPQALLKQLMTGGMGGGGLGAGGLLDGLLEELDLGGSSKNKETKEKNAWWKTATDAAQEKGYRSVRITRLTQDMINPVAKVEVFLFAELTPGSWKPVHTSTVSVNRNEIAQEDVDALKEDPQVEKVVGIFKSLGGGNESILDTALRQGAATQKAMNQSSEKFFEFLDRYSKATDSPPLETE